MADFVASPWYSDIVYVLQHLQAPEGLSKSRARSIKLKAAKFCILNQYLYWKDPGGVLLNCLSENEAQHTVKEFHNGDCGGPSFLESDCRQNSKSRLLLAYIIFRCV